jgi:hypothetical protein
MAHIASQNTHKKRGKIQKERQKKAKVILSPAHRAYPAPPPDSVSGAWEPGRGAKHALVLASTPCQQKTKQKTNKNKAKKNKKVVQL